MEKGRGTKVWKLIKMAPNSGHIVLIFEYKYENTKIIIFYNFIIFHIDSKISVVSQTDEFTIHRFG